LKRNKIALNIVISIFLIAITTLTLIEIYTTNDLIADIVARCLFIFSGLLLLVVINMDLYNNKKLIRIKRIFTVFSLICIVLSTINFFTNQSKDQISNYLNTVITDDILFFLSGIVIICILFTLILDFVMIFKMYNKKLENKEKTQSDEQQELHVKSEEQETEDAEENEKLD
jgi:NADH:ubiquinone oxidoreductase subunit 5 (subunit L)/multisubunit Na+/H+ antiporter MnhA subunit